MPAVEVRVARWTEIVSELVGQQRTAFPRRVVADAIVEDFGQELSWSWKDRSEFGFELRESVHGWPDPEVMAAWGQVGLSYHPLIRWFTSTRSTSPMTTGRVPDTIAPSWCFSALRETMAPTGLEHQLSIPYVMSPARHRAFVVVRDDEDFSDEDLEVARRLQPLLMLLERQSEVLAAGAGAAPTTLDAADGLLTGRELAVLVLLDEGRTAEAIAHTLGISPRTVHKHLENLYRKLGVGDRLRAVTVAREAGLLAAEESRAWTWDSSMACGGTRWAGRLASPGAAEASLPVV